MKSYQQFFAELKRRHVFKVAAIYGATSFVVLQAAELVLPRLGLPDWTVTFMVAILLLAFPVALILAWAFEMTPDGVKKTEAAESAEIEAIVAQPAATRWTAGLLALAGVAALLASGWWIGRRSVDPSGAAAGGSPADVRLALNSSSDTDDRPSIAVLPFVNLSADENQEYFSDGMTEEILNTLAKIAELRVSGRTSAFAYKGRNVDLREIGRELGVRYLIEGSVRKAGDQLRITAQLIDASDGSHLWSEQYDRTLEDVFAIQTDIAESIAGELRVPLGLEDDERLVSPTGDLTAYDLYLAGRTKMRERGPGLLEAARLFEAAIARDSAWAPAWAALAEAREIRIWYPSTFEGGVADSAQIAAALAASEAAASRALDLDPRNASALVALASVRRDRGQWADSEATYRRALSIDPDNAEAHQQYGELLREVGRLAESVRALDRAAALDPALIRIAILGFGLELDDRLDEAIEVYRLGIHRDPGVSLPRLWGGAGSTHLLAGRYEEAEEVLQTLFRQAGPRPGAPVSEIDPGQIARFVRAFVEKDPSLIPLGARPIAPEHWMLLGEPDSAMAAIPAAIELGAAGLPGATPLWYPQLDPLRSDPRFERFIAEARVPRDRPLRTPPAERSRPRILQSAVREAGE